MPKSATPKPHSFYLLNSPLNDLVELTRQYPTETPDEGEQELLTELLSLRTGAIAIGLAKTKQYANQIDQKVSQLKGNANLITKTSTPEDTNGEPLTTIADLFFLQRKMLLYDALTSAATGVGTDRSYKLLRKIEKEKRKR